MTAAAIVLAAGGHALTVRSLAQRVGPLAGVAVLALVQACVLAVALALPAGRASAGAFLVPDHGAHSMVGTMAAGAVLGVGEALAAAFLFSCITGVLTHLVPSSRAIPRDPPSWLGAARAWQQPLQSAAQQLPRRLITPLAVLHLAVQEVLFRGALPAHLAGLPAEAAWAVAVLAYTAVQAAWVGHPAELAYPVAYGLVVGGVHTVLALAGVPLLPLMVAAVAAFVYTALL